MTSVKIVRTGVTHILRCETLKVQPPLSYRWLRASGVTRLLPWHFLDADEGQRASDQFAKESRGNVTLYTFARRQDCDDFAGFQFVEGKVTDQIIYYHPSFQDGGRNDEIVTGMYPDLRTFLRDVVIPNTSEWCDEENFKAFLSPKK